MPDAIRLLQPPVAAPAPPKAPVLVTSNAPPLRLPGEHFIFAFTALLLGALGLAWVAPELAAGGFVSTRVVAVVHVFTLGFICVSIFGALYQFLPVAIGTPIRSERLAHVTFVMLLVAIPTFLTALLAVPSLLTVGGGLMAAAFLAFLGNFVATLAAAKERGVTWWALSGAAVYLLVTLSLGFTLALNLHTGVLGGSRFETLLVHVHLALVGWVMLVMVGVGHRLLPMFMLSHGASETPAKVAVACLAGGCALIGLPLGVPAVRVAGFAVIGVGVVAFLTQAAAFYRKRKKKTLDAGMRLAVSGLGGLLVALALGPLAWLAGWQSVTVVTGYVFVLLVGGISLFVAGHYFKIVPFVVWYHRYGKRVGRERVPTVAQLYSAKAAMVAVLGLVLGAALTAAGILLGNAWVIRAGAGVFFVGACVEAQQMLWVGFGRHTVGVKA